MFRSQVMVAAVVRRGCHVGGEGIDGAEGRFGLAMPEAKHQLQEHLRVHIVGVAAGGAEALADHAFDDR